MSSRYFTDDNLFASLDPEEGYYDDVRQCAMTFLFDRVKIGALVSAHQVVFNPRSMAR